MKYIKVGLSIAVLVLLQGCATDQTDKRLDEKLLRQPKTISRRDIHRESAKWIEISASLTSDEKSKLMSLRESTASKDSALRDKSLKLRAVLIKDILSENENQEEVLIVQQELQSVEHERLSVLFAAIRDANRIMGRWGSRNERESEQFYDDMMREFGQPGVYF